MIIAETGTYFVTICGAESAPSFSTISRNGKVELTPVGHVINQAIQAIPQKYPLFLVCEYVIMPDHVHLLVTIQANEKGEEANAASLSAVICKMKEYVTKQSKISLCQNSFYEHIVRNKADYEEKSEYIRNNPRRWLEKTGFR